jgi:hypothetical protein
MVKKKIRLSIALVIGFCLFASLLQFMPVSISLGERCDVRADPASAFLQPGHVYLVRVDKPMNPPDGMKPIPQGSFGAGFFHDGKRDDDPKHHCQGDITVLLQDDGHRKYRCQRCNKVWDRINESEKGELR